MGQPAEVSIDRWSLYCVECNDQHSDTVQPFRIIFLYLTQNYLGRHFADHLLATYVTVHFVCMYVHT